MQIKGCSRRLNPRCVQMLLCCVLFCNGFAFGEIRLSQLFSEHAVLQRDRPIQVWGWAVPHAKLLIRFHDQETEADVDDDGRWRATLQPEGAGGRSLSRCKEMVR